MTSTSSTQDDFFKEEIEESKRNPIPSDQIAALKADVRSNNKYSLEETKTRNVLIVGRTRSGKSTAVGILKDPCFEPKQMSIFSDTVEPKFQSFSLDNTLTQVKYTVNVIDTPGLKEVKQMGIEARSDATIIETINYCLKNEITKINVLLIFISFELGVTKDDVDAFRSFLEKFGHESIKIGICITRSEDKDQQWQKNVEEQLNQHAYFNEVLKRPNISICFTGCVDPQKTALLSNVDDLKKIYIKVYNLRRKVLEIVFGADNQVSLLELPIAKNVVENLTTLFENQSEILKYLENNTDFGTSAAQQKIADFSLNVDALKKSEGLLFHPILFDAFTNMRQRVKDLKKKMNPKDFVVLQGRLAID